MLEILVHPEYRRRGIGSELVKRLTSDPLMRVLALILGTPSEREFYESTGCQCVNEVAYFIVFVRDEYGEDLSQPVET